MFQSLFISQNAYMGIAYVWWLLFVGDVFTLINVRLKRIV
jgi:hypothetical protein